MTTDSSSSSSDTSNGRAERVAILRREVDRPRWTSPPKVGIVYSAENWDLVAPLVNDLRYELTENYHFSPVSIRVTQAESIHDIPLYISHSHQRSDIVFALGVVFRSAPDYEQRLVDLVTQRIGAITVPARVPVFDCMLVRDSRKHLEAQLLAARDGSQRLAAIWARRAIDAYTMLTRPTI
ncbi:hypothetical protein LPJ61_006136 [Coemansia biformis]|uniref:6,7-dimethyl-8-ribityllumazine synthase n=1 Tax=Coemansia biformis TaxID=1286918 RepID=A0A9W8CNU7_9FUNG|nr:hypothetical protein LPJ61_006136 [Coemansia biformis]